MPAKAWPIASSNDSRVRASKPRSVLGGEHFGVCRSFNGHAGGGTSTRIAPMTVVLFQCPCGAKPSTRWPRWARPRSRVILVLALDSSRKISRAGSNDVCCRRQFRRARIMSGRSCSLARSVFFYMSAPYSPVRNESLAACNPRLWPFAVPPRIMATTLFEML